MRTSIYVYRKVCGKLCQTPLRKEYEKIPPPSSCFTGRNLQEYHPSEKLNVTHHRLYIRLLRTRTRNCLVVNDTYAHKLNRVCLSLQEISQWNISGKCVKLPAKYCRNLQMMCNLSTEVLQANDSFLKLKLIK